MNDNWKTYPDALPDLGEYPTLDAMSRALADFCALTGAPALSADELAAEPGVTMHVYAWLCAFSEICEDIESAEPTVVYLVTWDGDDGINSHAFKSELSRWVYMINEVSRDWLVFMGDNRLPLSSSELADTINGNDGWELGVIVEELKVQS